MNRVFLFSLFFCFLSGFLILNFWISDFPILNFGIPDFRKLFLLGAECCNKKRRLSVLVLYFSFIPFYCFFFFYFLFLFLLECHIRKKNHKNFPFFEFLILENRLNELAKSQFRNGDYQHEE